MRLRSILVLTLAILNLSAIGVLGLQWASKKTIDQNTLWLTVGLDIFGAVIFFTNKDQ